MTSQSPDIKTGKTPIRAPSSVPVDDAVLPFDVDALDLRGRLTRLGPALDDVLTKHDYPAPVGKLLGEAIVLATLRPFAIAHIDDPLPRCSTTVRPAAAFASTAGSAPAMDSYDSPWNP